MSSARRVMVPFGLGLLTAAAVPVALMALGAARLMREEEERVAVASGAVVRLEAQPPSQPSQRSREQVADEADLIIEAVMAVRRFEVDEHDRLRPLVMQEGFVWESGINTAVCAHDDHPAPSPDCSCGLYALNSTRELPLGHVTGVVELTGLLEAGAKGYRAERGQVVALAPARGESVMPMALLAPGVFIALGIVMDIPASVIAAVSMTAFLLFAAVAAGVHLHQRRRLVRVQRLYPQVACYRSEKEMLAAHPLTAPAQDLVQGGGESWRSDR